MWTFGKERGHIDARRLSRSQTPAVCLRHKHVRKIGNRVSGRPGTPPLKVIIAPTYIRALRPGRSALRVLVRRRVIVDLGGLLRNLGLERYEMAFHQKRDRTAVEQVAREKNRIAIAGARSSDYTLGPSLEANATSAVAVSGGGCWAARAIP